MRMLSTRSTSSLWMWSGVCSIVLDHLKWLWPPWSYWRSGQGCCLITTLSGAGSPLCSGPRHHHIWDPLRWFHLQTSPPCLRDQWRSSHEWIGGREQGRAHTPAVCLCSGSVWTMCGPHFSLWAKIQRLSQARVMEFQCHRDLGVEGWTEIHK